MVQRGGGSGSGDGISWQADMMRSAAGLNQVLAWETLWMGEGRVYLGLDVFGMPVRLGGCWVGTLVLLLPSLYDLGLLLLYLYNGTITMLLV